MEEKVFLGWDWIEDQLAKVAQAILENEEISYVTGIPRGGVIPAIMFSHRFGIPYIEFAEAVNLPESTRKTVVCLDDIADSGRTLEEVETLNFITATLAYRKHSSTEPNYYGEFIEHEGWLVYPWENENSKTVQDYLVE